MNRIHRGRNVLGLACLVGLTAAAPVQAQTVSNGAYYATPSWDQTLPAAQRFIVLANFANAAVLDRETGLVWERKIVVDGYGLLYTQAYDRCAALVIGGRAGWRLPTLPEMASLVDVTQEPRLPQGHPFDLSIIASAYGDPAATSLWTTTPLLGGTGDSGTGVDYLYVVGLLQSATPAHTPFVWDGYRARQYHPALCVRGPGGR